MIHRILMAYLSLTRGERNGFFLLAILLLLLLAGRILIPVIIERPIPDFKESETAFLAFISAMQEAETSDRPEQVSAGMQNGSKYPPSYSAVQYFHFNPNIIAYKELLTLGLPERVARTLIKYRDSGGEFRSKTDLLKVYGLKVEDYSRLEPYIDIASLPVREVKEQVPISFELNGTDSIKLQEIYGIGPVFARRIIRYRDMLGGFYSREQLKEVYGLREEQYDEIMKHVFIDTSYLRRINLNSVERETLLKHPYLNVYQADAIIAYGEYKGEWKDIHEIKSNVYKKESTGSRPADAKAY